MSHFSVATFEVHELDYSVSMTTLKKGLYKYPFRFLLKKMYLYYFAKILAREEYSNAKEAYKLHGTPTNAGVKEENNANTEKPPLKKEDR